MFELTKEVVRPIPKYIVKLIKEKDSEFYKSNYIFVRYYTYFTKFKKELLQVIVAVKSKGKSWYCKQVVIKSLHSLNCLIKDINLSSMAGYIVGWYAEGLSKKEKWFEDGKWYEVNDKYYNLISDPVNKDFILKMEKYKYSAVDKYTYSDVMNYLKLYEKYPQAEYLVKMGLSKFATSKKILALVGKDKGFRNFLIKIKDEVQEQEKEYYISSIIQAYKDNIDLNYSQRYQYFLKSIMRDDYFKKVKNVFEDKLEKLFDYLDVQKTNCYSYIDYLKACEYLGLDMSLDKNRVPHDFNKWHDIRIDEYTTAKMKEDKKKRREFYKKFSEVAKKYSLLERNLDDDYAVLIAKSPSELIKEGSKLNHCVGKMDYDQKFVREQSLIFFVRVKESLEKPFVTLEYSVKLKKIFQCYGKEDIIPEKSVLDFVNKKWLPYANRKIKKLCEV